MALSDGMIAVLNMIPGSLAARFRNGALVTRALRPLVNRLLPGRAAWIVVRSGPARGLRLLIEPKTEKFYWTGAHEVAVQQTIADLLKPGMTFWDVGAHIGFFSLLASRRVGARGRVHAFEPMAQNRARLEAAIAANGLTNVTVHELALGRVGGDALLYPHESSLMWTLCPEPGRPGGVTVRCRSLDEVAESAGSPDLIKVDAEGAEVDVLRGGLRLLSRLRPPLVVEFSSDAVVADARALVPFYTFSRLGPHHWLLAARL